MADISKCPGIGCPKKEECRRYNDPASRIQSYIDGNVCIKNDFILFLPLRMIAKKEKIR